jgi:hypothetical protein
MADAISRRMARKLWTIFFGHDSWVRQNEDFRTKERYGLVVRANYAYGMLRAADSAKYNGIQSVTVVELGVASGGGLLNMIDCADLITKETGVRFRIVGFDTGAGLPSVEGVKDHPEIWNPGDFIMEDRTSLERKIAGKAEIIWGDIDNNIDSFVSSLTPESPLGFVSVDVDLYSATKAGLRCFAGEPNKYLPAISVYCDDVSFFTANKWCGELAAIEEFNSEHEARKIDQDRSLILRPKKIETWYPAMYVCHILDHSSRQRSRDRRSLAIGEHAEFISVAKV